MTKKNDEITKRVKETKTRRDEWNARLQRLYALRNRFSQGVEQNEKIDDGWRCLLAAYTNARNEEAKRLDDIGAILGMKPEDIA